MWNHFLADAVDPFTALLAQEGGLTGNNRNILMILCIVAAIGAIVYALVPHKETEDDMMLRMKGKRREDTEKGQDQQRVSAIKKALEGRMGKKVADIVAGDNQQESNRLRMSLASAGFRQPSASTIFLAIKGILGILFGGIGITLYFTTEGAYEWNTRLLMLVGCIAVGFMGPNFWLNSVVSNRQRKIRNGLPDALDLMVVTVESGLALDAAIMRVSEELQTAHPELCEELGLAIGETRLGVPRSETLTKMAERTGVMEVKSLVAIIVQAEKFGTSIARALRNQSQVLRVKRRQKAEEKAAQCAVKLLLPLIFFIFPALFIVLAGPGALSIIKTFSEGSM